MELAEEMLRDFELWEILELNDLQEKEVLKLLIENGLINVPERYFL
jgi:hypothetical protein